MLEKKGFEVTKGVGNVETSFLARPAESGVFNEMETAMMFHPGSTNIPAKDMLGRIKFKIEFFGCTAHASGSPDKGINALDALVMAYSGINAYRQHLRPDGRIHGIITHGGDAPNIIPDYAAKMLAMTAWDFLNSPELRERVRQDFATSE